MRRYKNLEINQSTQELDEVICNQCGKSIKIENGVQKAEMCEVTKRWGYFSNKDLEVHTFDLCEECYDRLIEGFKVPIDKK